MPISAELLDTRQNQMEPGEKNSKATIGAEPEVLVLVDDGDDNRPNDDKSQNVHYEKYFFKSYSR